MGTPVEHLTSGSARVGVVCVCVGGGGVVEQHEYREETSLAGGGGGSRALNIIM